MSEEFETSYTPEEKAYLDTKGGEKAPPPAPVEDDGDDEADVAASDDVSASDDTNDRSDKGDGEQQAKRSRVPLRKFIQEEERRKSAEKEAQTLREQIARFDERMKVLQQINQHEEPKDEAPDPSQDPIGAIQWQQRQIEAQRQAYEQQQRSQQEQAVISQIDNGYRRAFSEFASEKTDAPMAYRHFTNALGAYFQNMGVPDAQIDALVIQEERRLAYQAAQRGQNPAEIVYNMAKQFGYQPKAQEDAGEHREAIEKAEKDIDRRQKAAAASKSISNASGSRGGRAPTAQELISMSDEEFAEMRSKLSDREFRRIAGG